MSARKNISIKIQISDLHYIAYDLGEIGVNTQVIAASKVYIFYTYCIDRRALECIQQSQKLYKKAIILLITFFSNKNCHIYIHLP